MFKPGRRRLTVDIFTHGAMYGATYMPAAPSYKEKGSVANLKPGKVYAVKTKSRPPPNRRNMILDPEIVEIPKGASYNQIRKAEFE